MVDFSFQRDYNIPDSELTMFTQHICDSMTRDIILFGAYGILAADVTSLQTLCDAFEIFPTDEYIYQEYQTATETKDNLIADMKVTIRSMALRVELKWGKSSPKYKSLGIADMSQITDEAFITRARMIYAFMVENKTTLASEGLTQLMLDDMDDKILALDDAKRAQIDKNSLRAEKTTERIVKGNELYRLVSRYCEIGKRIWDGVNPAFYGDYIIYSGSTPGALTAPTGLGFILANMTIRWNAVENATSYSAEISDGEEFTVVYSGSDTSFVFEPTFFGEIKLRVRGRNQNGFGPYSQEYRFTYYDILPPPADVEISLISSDTGLIKLTFSEVASATTYKIFRSVVPLGSPAGEFVYITEQAGTEYVGNTTAGMRNWFEVKASNETQISTASEAVYLDMTVVPV